MDIYMTLFFGGHYLYIVNDNGFTILTPTRVPSRHHEYVRGSSNHFTECLQQRLQYPINDYLHANLVTILLTFYKKVRQK